MGCTADAQNFTARRSTKVRCVTRFAASGYNIRWITPVDEVEQVGRMVEPLHRSIEGLQRVTPQLRRTVEGLQPVKERLRPMAEGLQRMAERCGVGRGLQRMTWPLRHMV